MLPAFNPKDIDPHLTRRHRDLMLDLILAWGSLDGGLRILLSRVLNLDMLTGADLIERMPATAVLVEVRKALRVAGATPAGLRVIKRHEKSYRTHARARNRIAHSRCAGVWTEDRNYLVFAAFERVEDDKLAVDLTPMEEMERATRWGKAMTQLALRISDA
jgi:hypothetical protein